MTFMATLQGTLSRLPLIIRVVAALLAAAAGGVVGVVCFVSTMFQANGGFLAKEPRQPLLILFALATLTCIAIPATIWRLMLPRHPWWGLVLVITLILILSIPTLPIWLPHGSG